MTFKEFLIERFLIERELIYTKETEEFFNKLGEDYPKLKKWINKSLKNWIRHKYLSIEDKRYYKKAKFNDVFTNVYNDKELLSLYSEKNKWLDDEKRKEKITGETTYLQINNPDKDYNVYQFDIDQDPNLKALIASILKKVSAYINDHPNTNNIPSIDSFITTENDKSAIGSELVKELSDGWKLVKISSDTGDSDDIDIAIDYEVSYMNNCLKKDHTDLIKGTDKKEPKEIIYSIRKNKIPHCTMAVEIDTKRVTEIKGANNKEVKDEYLPYVIEALNYLKDKKEIVAVDETQNYFVIGENKFFDVTLDDDKFELLDIFSKKGVTTKQILKSKKYNLYLDKVVEVNHTVLQDYFRKQAYVTPVKFLNIYIIKDFSKKLEFFIYINKNCNLIRITHRYDDDKISEKVYNDLIYCLNYLQSERLLYYEKNDNLILEKVNLVYKDGKYQKQ